jgi:hypothetical protein
MEIVSALLGFGTVDPQFTKSSVPSQLIAYRPPLICQADETVKFVNAP